MEKALIEELDSLLEAQEMETAVHERAHAFLDERILHLQDQKDVWTKELISGFVSFRKKRGKKKQQDLFLTVDLKEMYIFFRGL